MTDAAGNPIDIADLPGRQAIHFGQGEAVLRVKERATGSVRWTEVRSFAVTGTSGRVDFVVNIVRDVTTSVEALRAEASARRREEEARRRAEYLSRATALLGESLQYETTLERMASLIVPDLADWCAIDLLDAKTGELRRLAVAHIDPEKIRWAREIHRRYPPDMASPSGIGKVLRTGEAELHSSVTDDMIARSARSVEQLELIRNLGLQSVMLVPLRANGRTAGIISFIAAESGRHYSAEDLEFAVELGHRAGIAIEHAELHRDAVVARVEAERAYEAAAGHAKWLSRLQQLTVGLSRSVTFADVVDSATTLGRNLFEAKTASVWLFGDGRATLRLNGQHGFSSDMVARTEVLPLDSPYPVAEAARSGDLVLVEDQESLIARYPQISEVIRASGAVAVASAPVKVGGEIIGVLSFRYDAPQKFSDDYVTAFRTFSKELGQALARTRIHAELETAKKAADAASQAKSSFLATMSHELRTPINAILGFADLLELGIVDDDRVSRSEYVGRIRKNSQHLLEVINDILDWSKVEAGQLVIDPTDGIASDVMTDALNVVRDQAAARGISLTSHCALRANYIGDPMRVRQILLNLLSNAIKFTPPGGQVTLSCKTAGACTTFVVEDTGIGIAADHLDAIFEPFIQSAPVYTREHGGTGLGLSISRRLARLMDGDVSVESALGQGARFTLTLPTRRVGR